MIKWKPIKIKNNSHDTLIIRDYIMTNYRTTSYFRGRQFDFLDEDSVLNEMNSVLISLGLKTSLSAEVKNRFDTETVFDERVKSFYKGIEKNVHNIIESETNLTGKYILIPALMFHKRHFAGSFNGPGEVNIFYDVVFFVFIFNDKNELIYKNERSIRAKSESIWHWEEALAFPIEDRVKKEHFEEMVREVLRNYID